MTTTNQTNKTRQHGNGITDTFNFAFPIFQSSDLEVYKIDTTTTPETPTELKETTDYTVEISKTTEGGSVTFVVTPTNDEDIFIKRILPYTQQTEIPINGNFPEENVENELDKSRMIDIQNKEETDRTLKVNEFYDGSADFEIANPEAGKVIGWDDTGLIMVNYSGSDLDTILTSTYGQQLVQSANALGARNLLELGASNDVEFNDITANDVEFNDITAESLALTKGALNIQGKYWGWGMVPSSSSGNPDEDIDVTVGKMLCEDGTTIVELTVAESDLDLPTLNGGALGNDTTYHLFRYLKDDDTMQWHLDTSLTPTIANIKSALAYRRIVSVLTDASGDILPFIGREENAGININYTDDILDLDTSGVPNADTDLVLSVPLGLYLMPSLALACYNSTVGTPREPYVKSKITSNYVWNSTVTQGLADGTGRHTSANVSRCFYVDTAGKIVYGDNVAGADTDMKIWTIGYFDPRNQF